MSALTQSRVRELLTYNPQTGELRWKVRRGGSAVPGALADSINAAGYMRVGIDKVRYATHRVVWLYMYGEWPAGDVDHINGIRHDNRLSNLRVVTQQQNCWNQRRPQQGNPYLGVYQVASNKFMALITVSGCRHYLGRFSTAEDARDAYLAAKAKLHSYREAVPTDASLEDLAKQRLKRAHTAKPVDIDTV